MLQSWLTPDPRSLLTLPLALPPGVPIPLILCVTVGVLAKLAAALGRPASRTEGVEGVLLVIGEAVVAPDVAAVVGRLGAAGEDGVGARRAEHAREGGLLAAELSDGQS